MAAALSWCLVLQVVFNSNCIDVRADSVVRGHSGDLLDQTTDNTSISGSTDLFGGRSKKLNVADTFQLSVLLVLMRRRLINHEVLPKIRVDLLRKRLQLPGKAPVILRGDIDDNEKLELFLRPTP